MKTILILSDTHNNPEAIYALSEVIGSVDYIISLGDTQSDYSLIKKLSKEKLIAVKGNCDSINLISERLIEIEGLRIFATHGHNYCVKTDCEGLILRAKDLQANVVLYGHTHRAEIERIDDILLINPGTLSNRPESTYCYMVIVKNKALPKIVKANKQNILI